MAPINRYLTIAGVIIIGILLQVILIWADCKNTPTKAAVEFSKAFYRLDPAMSELLCKKYLAGDNGNLVENYIQKVSNDARERGRGQNYMKSILYHIETYTQYIDDTTAQVKLTAKRRRSINPIYALIGKFFFIGKTYKVDVLIPLVKEDGKWKVCENIFALLSV